MFKLKPIKGMICDSKRIFEITRNLCYQFKHENMPETMAELGRNNLMLIVKFLNGNINFFQLLKVIITLPKKKIFISAFEVIKERVLYNERT